MRSLLNKTSFNYLKLLFLYTLISCSDQQQFGGGAPVPPVNNGAPTIDGEFRLTLQPLPFFSNLPWVIVRPNILTEADDKKLKGIQLWSNKSDCSGELDGYAARASFLTNGAQVAISENQDNLISYRVLYENDSVGPCVAVATVTHDTISPSPVTVDADPIKTRTEQIYFPITGIADDVKDLEFFYNGSDTPSATVSALLWRNNQGFIVVPLNTTTSVTVKARDNAGNLSVASASFDITHKNTLPNEPILDVSLQALNGTVVSASNITIFGSVDSDVVSITVYKNSVFTTPVATMTPLEFSSGSVVDLEDGAVNYIYITATDEFGNTSPAGQLVLLVSQAPNYSYALVSNNGYSNNPVAKGSSSYIRVEIVNGSYETTLSAPVRVSNITVSESSGNISVDSTRGCSVDGLFPASVCSIYLLANYPTVGIKNETLSISLNGTTVSLSVEIEVVEPVLNSISGPHLASLGSFVKLDLTERYLIFTNGIVRTTDLANPIFDSSLATDMANAEASVSTLQFVIKAGKINLIDQNLNISEISSTRSYSPGDIIRAVGVGTGSAVAVILDNGLGSKDVLISDHGEILNRDIDSNVTSGVRSYYRSDSTLRSFGVDLSDTAVPGVTVSGDIFSGVDGVYFMGDSGTGSSLHKVSQAVLSNTGELAGAGGFSEVLNRFFAFASGANYGLFSFDEIFSDAVAPFTASDLKINISEDRKDAISIVNIQTSAGDRSVISKLTLPELTRVTKILDRSVYGDTLGTLFNKDGDYLIFNKTPTSIGLGRFSEDYVDLTEIAVINANSFIESYSTEEKLIFINEISNKKVINVVDLSSETNVTSLNYYAPVDIGDGESMRVLKLQNNDLLVYYQITPGNYSFKTIRVY